MLSINSVDLFNKTVLLRLDLNVPIKNGEILSDNRIISSLPTIKKLLENNCRVIIASHLGRPKEGIYDANFSMYPVVKKLENLLNCNINLIKYYLDKNIIWEVNDKIVVLENVRFNKGEKFNDHNLSKRYSELCDVFVMDAFATAHRKHSSTYGVMYYTKKACMGLLFEKEIKFLSNILVNPKRPFVSIVGGAKVSSKFNILKNLSKISDILIVGGGISNTFIAIDNNVGNSLYEKNFVNKARHLRDNNNIIVPVDCRVGKCFSEFSSSCVKNINEINDNEEIMDFGDKTCMLIENIILKSKTVLWNGPVGVFEFPNFCFGTKMIVRSLMKNDIFSVVGGGDTISALEMFGDKSKISYISTGGGSFLEFIEGKKLYSIEALEKFV